MPERGGSTTQSGIQYQNAAAALYFGRLCDARQHAAIERVTSVWLEATEPVDDLVVEFADGHTAYFQAKENIASSGEEWKVLWAHCKAQYEKDSFGKDRDEIVLLIGSRLQRHADLRLLCDRASTTETYEAWMGRTSIAQKKVLDRIKPHLGLLSDAECHHFFQHLKVHLWPLEDIEHDMSANWIPESTLPLASVFAVLRDYAGTTSSRRKRLTAPFLTSYLREQHGIRFRTQPETTALRAALRGCSGFLRQQIHTIAGTDRHIDRAIVQDIVKWICDDSGKDRVAMLLDQAGVGKTVVMHDVLLALEEQGIPVLAIKADQQLSGVTTQSELQSRLDLPIPIEEVVAALTTQSTVVILVDQVDALSLSLAHDHQTLAVILDLVARLRVNQAVRIVLSCRSFDRDNDPRLRRLNIPKTFPLIGLTDDEVSAVLADMGIVFATLHPTTRQLLRTPLHLDLFGRIIERHHIVAPPLHLSNLVLGNLQDLYTLLWKDVVILADADAPPAADRGRVLQVMTHRMHQDQRIAVPQSLFTTVENASLGHALRWLLSAGIVVPGATEYSFFHQTFFDYCYAREFVDSGDRLAETVLTSDQGLFVRPQLVQILAYMRGTNENAYRRELRELLSATQLRYHLRVHLFRWFGALPDPTPNEWQIARPLLFRDDTRALFLFSIGGNAGWFGFLKGPTLDEMLGLDDALLQAQVVPYLQTVINANAKDVAVLLCPFIGKKTLWNGWIHWILYGVKTWEAPEAVALYEALLTATPTIRRDMLHDIEKIAQAHPDAACRIIYQIVTQELDEYIAKRDRALPDDYLSHSSFSSRLEDFHGSQIVSALEILSANVPALFFSTLLPWLEQVVHLDSPPPADWSSFRSDGFSSCWHDHVYVVQESLRRALIRSLIKVAEAESSAFPEIAAQLASMPYETPQLLLVEAYKAHPKRFASDALTFLITDRRRLELGSRQCYDARQLIAAIHPHLSADERQRLEHAIVAEKDLAQQDWRWTELKTLYLLQALPEESWSPEAIAVLDRLQRQYPGVKATDDPRTIHGGIAGSPIPTDTAEGLSDEMWLAAMTKYAAPTRDIFESLMGGAHELGQVLFDLVKKEPDRFFALALQTPPDCNIAYVDAFVRGLAESEILSERIFAVVRHFQRHPDRLAKRQIIWGLQKRVADGIPADLLALMEDYLHDTQNDPSDNMTDPHFGCINSVRGSAFETIMQALLQQGTPNAKRHMWELIEYLAADPFTMLRAGAIEQLLYRLHEDRERAVQIFGRIMAGHPTLLQCYFTQEFLYYASYQHVATMLPYMRRLLEVEHEQSQQRGAELVCLVAISRAISCDDKTRAEIEELAASLTTGRVTWRRGATRIYARNLILERLTVSFNDEDESVRTAASGFFGGLHYDHTDPVNATILAFARSASLYNATHMFTDYLWEYGIIATEWMLPILETAVNNPKEPHRHFFDSTELMKLILRVYTGSLDTAIRSRTMDMFDTLMQRFPFAASPLLDEWDRR